MDNSIPQSVIWAKYIAARLPKELGFVNRAALIESFNRKELLVIGKKAFCHFHHRLDDQTTIYEIGVSKQLQGKGFGKKLLNKLIKLAKSKKKLFILAKCPVNLSSNGFYKKMGFKLSKVEKGRKRKLNVWVLHI